MSKLRKWLMKDERVSSSDSVDPEIKLFGSTIGVSQQDAEGAEVVDETTDSSSRRERAPPGDQYGGCESAGDTSVVQPVGVVCESTGDASVVQPLPEAETSPEAGYEQGSSSNGMSCEESGVTNLAAPTMVGSCSTVEVLDNRTSKVASTAVQKAEVFEDGKKEEGQGTAQQQKPILKKPDRSAPCPRCDSLDTKFCYYNNYNVNQPRHFCKNCQRYWTAGGTLRNVPVGAGRRKNKHGGLLNRHGGLSDSPVVRPDSADMAQPCKVSNSSPLKLPPVQDQVSPLPTSDLSSPTVSNMSSCGRESAVSDDVTRAYSMHAIGTGSPQQFSSSNNFIATGSRMSISGSPVGSRLLHEMARTSSQHGASGTSGAAPGEAQDREPVEDSNCPLAGPVDLPDPGGTKKEPAAVARNQPTNLQPVCGGLARPVGIYDGSVWTGGAAPFGLYNGSWPHGFNVGWSGPTPAPVIAPPGTMMTGQTGVPTWPTPPNAVWSGVCWTPSIISGMPAAIPGTPWMSPGWGGGWTVPWVADPAAAAAAAAAAASASASVQAAASNPGSGMMAQSRLPIRPVLNKHPREHPELERVKSALWVPKMVRLDDPGNTPRSSVWTALGVENRLESGASGSIFKAFLPKAESKAAGESGDRNQLES